MVSSLNSFHCLEVHCTLVDEQTKVHCISSRSCLVYSDVSQRLTPFKNFIRKVED
jgi:hypothetical protein